VLAAASTYRTVHHQLLHIRACRTSASLQQHQHATSRSPARHIRVAGVRALSFPSTSCKSSAARSIFPWHAPTLYLTICGCSRTLHRPTTARVISPEITPNCPFPALHSLRTRPLHSARLLFCLGVYLYSPKAAASCTSSSGDANASSPPHPDDIVSA
jgi:hypothetical protein